MELDKIPAYRRAKELGAALEENLRLDAFLPLPEKVCGIQVVPLTLRILTRLSKARSPFVIGGRIRVGDIAAFFWAVSPGYVFKSVRRRNAARDELLLQIGRLSFLQSVRGIRRYLYYAWLDRPPTTRRHRGTPASVAFAAIVCHHLASAYGWDDEVVLDKPLRRLFQYLSLIRLEANPKYAVTFNPIIDRLTRPIRKRLLQ